MNKKGFVNVAIIVVIIVIVGIAGYFVLNKQSSSPIPTPTDLGARAITVSLGEEFTLKKGGTARLGNLDVFLKVKDFIYSPCPKGSQCVWSGLAVVYELTVDRKVYDAPLGNLPPEAPYNVLVKNTDYKTYADFVIEKPETSCANRSGISQDECWRGLTKRYSDSTYCDKIQSLTTKDACFEDLAEKLNNDNLCNSVTSPKQYCRYLDLVSTKSLSQCESIIIFHWRARCFKDIAQQSGQGISICNTLEINQANICREAITGSDY
ncbi:hypothetical protein KKB40_02870 [Patescibacteria group bacterium]|nr:hypothetical protein [Patescibacteria group bacterium]